ncbi:MAG: MBL fold metallo-hydrolase [Isosphaeraceae bacterium]
MPVRFAVLASGSRGNSALVRSGNTGLLLDLGIGPRSLSARLESVGASWDHLGAALLTHTHGDHVDEHSLATLARRRIPLYCHEGHRVALRRYSGFQTMEAEGLARNFDERPFLTPNGLSVEPVELRHDGGPTFGFRVEARPDRGKRPVSLGYLADTGCWTPSMADLMTDVDLLGVEFNHDVEMQRASNRHPSLIRRNLGDRGHLSNRQAADFVVEVLSKSGRGAVKHLVLLHLSAQCNRPELALKAARGAARITGRRLTVHVALQEPAHPHVLVQPGRRLPPPALNAVRRTPVSDWLPF